MKTALAISLLCVYLCSALSAEDFVTLPTSTEKPNQTEDDTRELSEHEKIRRAIETVDKEVAEMRRAREAAHSKKETSNQGGSLLLVNPNPQPEPQKPAPDSGFIHIKPGTFAQIKADAFHAVLHDENYVPPELYPTPDVSYKPGWLIPHDISRMTSKEIAAMSPEQRKEATRAWLKHGENLIITNLFHYRSRVPMAEQIKTAQRGYNRFTRAISADHTEAYSTGLLERYADPESKLWDMLEKLHKDSAARGGTYNLNKDIIIQRAQKRLEALANEKDIDWIGRAEEQRLQEVERTKSQFKK